MTQDTTSTLTVNPAPIPTPAIIWDNLPSWANYVAMDSTGTWCCFENEPELEPEEDAWYRHIGDRTRWEIIPEHLAPAFEGDWLNSLTHRSLGTIPVYEHSYATDPWED